tara:strand:+ start:213 stop:362 length:150 start_codon:yes stop_codon:yes gene_type:complete
MKKITTDQLSILLRYLGTKPYVEVYNLIQIIGNLPDIESEKNGGKNNTK